MRCCVPCVCWRMSYYWHLSVWWCSLCLHYKCTLAYCARNASRISHRALLYLTGTTPLISKTQVYFSLTQSRFNLINSLFWVLYLTHITVTFPRKIVSLFGKMQQSYNSAHEGAGLDFKHWDVWLISLQQIGMRVMENTCYAATLLGQGRNFAFHIFT